jgi:hypothetical protein
VHQVSDWRLWGHEHLPSRIWKIRTTSERGKVTPKASLLLTVDELSRLVHRNSGRAKQKITLEDAVNLDLPVLTDRMGMVRRHDFNSVTGVNKRGGQGHSAVGRLLKDHAFL